MIKRLPNALTFLRLFLIPVFVFLMHEPSPQMVLWATGVFVLACFTDYADGVIARKCGAVSDFGKLLDPIADKILVMAALVMLVAQKSDEYGDPWVPAWMVVLVLAREIWVTGLRALAGSKGLVIPASQTGKIKSAAQMIAIVLLLLNGVYFFRFLGLKLWLHDLGQILLLFSIIVSYWGASEYTYQVLAPLESDSTPEPQD